MRFLIDNQLPLRLTNFFRSRGHDCEHVIDLRLDKADDAAVWAHAIAQDRIIVSKDDDFVMLAQRQSEAGRLVWVRLGNCRNDALIAAFDRIHNTMIEALAGGQQIFEVQ